MSTAIFDTLAYSKRLKKAGFTEIQAEAQAEAIAELVTEKLATKEDIRRLELATKNDIGRLEKEISNLAFSTKTEIQNLEVRLEDRLTHKLTLRFGTMLVAAVTLLATLIKLH